MARLLLLLLVATAARAAVLADQAVRYVNDEVITLGDVAMRNQMRIADYQRRGLVVPGTRAELLAFSQRTLEDLTDEALLVQEAAKLGMTSDHEGLVREVLDASKRAGAALTLRDQAEQRRLVERSRKVDGVIGYYEGHSPMPTPSALEDLYRRHLAEFARPPRARVLQMVVQPSPPEARQELRTAKNALLRRAQAVAAPVLRTAAQRRLDEFLLAAPARQEEVLDALVQDLAAHAGEADLDDAAAALVQDAAGIARRQAALRTPEDVRALLETARLALAGRWGRDLEDAFRAAARRLSQGPAADQGGQLGWVEPGTYSPAFDEAVFNRRPGTMSPVFQVGQAFCLVLVAERVEARTRSFDEVSGELDLMERRRRREQVRTTLVGILRAQAMIRDVAPLDAR